MIALIGGEIAKTGEKSSDCNIWWDEMAPAQGLRFSFEKRKIIRIGKLEECRAGSSPIQLGRRCPCCLRLFRQLLSRFDDCLNITVIEIDLKRFGPKCGTSNTF